MPLADDVLATQGARASEAMVLILSVQSALVFLGDQHLSVKFRKCKKSFRLFITTSLVILLSGSGYNFDCWWPPRDEKSPIWTVHEPSLPQQNTALKWRGKKWAKWWTWRFGNETKDRFELNQDAIKHTVHATVHDINHRSQNFPA